jgi:hypothetical protein
LSGSQPKAPGFAGGCFTGDPLDRFISNKEVLINGVQCTVTQVTTAPDGKTVTGFAVSPASTDSMNAAFRFITADFRIQSWRLHRDWSVTITGKRRRRATLPKLHSAVTRLGNGITLIRTSPSSTATS